MQSLVTTAIITVFIPKNRRALNLLVQRIRQPATDQCVKCSITGTQDCRVSQPSFVLVTKFYFDINDVPGIYQAAINQYPSNRKLRFYELFEKQFIEE